MKNIIPNIVEKISGWYNARNVHKDTAADTQIMNRRDFIKQTGIAFASAGITAATMKYSASAKSEGPGMNEGAQNGPNYGPGEQGFGPGEPGFGPGPNEHGQETETVNVEEPGTLVEKIEKIFTSGDSLKVHTVDVSDMREKNEMGPFRLSDESRNKWEHPLGTGTDYLETRLDQGSGNFVMGLDGEVIRYFGFKGNDGSIDMKKVLDVFTEKGLEAQLTGIGMTRNPGVGLTTLVVSAYAGGSTWMVPFVMDEQNNLVNLYAKDNALELKGKMKATEVLQVKGKATVLYTSEDSPFADAYIVELGSSGINYRNLREIQELKDAAILGAMPTDTAYKETFDVAILPKAGYVNSVTQEFVPGKTYSETSNTTGEHGPFKHQFMYGPFGNGNMYTTRTGEVE